MAASRSLFPGATSAPFSRRCAWLAVALLTLTGCGFTPRIQEREPVSQSDVGEVGVAIVAAAPFELFVADLRPGFEINAEAALKMVGASTRAIEDSNSVATQALLRLAPEVISGERKSSSVTDAAGVTTTTASSSRSAQAGDLSKVAAPTLPAGDLPAALAELAAPADINPILKFQLANSLIQEVRLLNDYVSRAPQRRDHARFIVRLQLHVQQHGRNTPYDAVTDIAFSAKGCDAKPVQVVPLLVNDNIDVSAAAVGRRQVRALGLALQGLRGNIGLGLDVGSRSEQLLRALGSEFNPVLTVGQTPGSNKGNSIRVRVGALEKGIDKHELVSRSYMVTALLLVPEGCSELKVANGQKVIPALGSQESEPSRKVADVAFSATTTFRHARHGTSVAADPGGYPTANGAVQLWSWPKPRFPGPQMARVELSGEKPPYLSAVELRGGDSLVASMLDRACLRSAAVAVSEGSEQCGRADALLAERVQVSEDRNGFTAHFGDRLAYEAATPEVGTGEVSFSGKKLTALCFDRIYEVAETRTLKGTCIDLQPAALKTFKKPDPKLSAAVKVSDARLIANAKGAASLSMSVTFPEPGKATRPDSVLIDISGAGLSGVRVLGGAAACATTTTTVTVTGDCAFIVDLINAAPGQLVRIKAVARKRGADGKPATELALEPNQSIFEVNLESPDFAIVLPPRPAPR